MPFSAQRCALLWQRPTFSLRILISLVSVTETSDMKRCLVNICAMQRLSVCVACLRIWSGPLKLQHPQNTSCTGASMAAARMWPSHLKMPAMPACRCLGKQWRMA